MIGSTFSGSLAAALVLLVAFTTARRQCITQDQPNPIKTIYPKEVTGLLNSTLAIASVPLEHVRRILPAGLEILETAYRSLLPDFPDGMYPVLIQGAHDHDISFLGLPFSDFSRAGFEFPFLDLLQDGYSSFRWAPSQLILSSNKVAVAGSEAYGTLVEPASFKPPCDAYGTGSIGETYLEATSVDSDKHMKLSFTSLGRNVSSPYPLSFFQNITNQPSFANGSTCDQMIRFFNTTVTKHPYDPIAVVGNATSNMGPFHSDVTFNLVYGFQVASAFIERNYLDCKSLQGYAP